MKSGKAPAIMGGDAQKEAAGMDELQLGDLVQMRKTHPCGSDKWTVIRVGADIKIRNRYYFYKHLNVNNI